MRVLHVIDPGSPGGGACTLQLLASPLQRLTSVKQTVLLIGSERHEALARRCGVEPAGRLHAPLNEPTLAGFRGSDFRRFLAAHERASGPFDLIHAWTARSALLTALAAPGHRRVGTLSIGPVNGVVMRALALVIERRPCALLATSVSVKRDYFVMGMDERHLDILRPAVHPESVAEQAEDREAIRARWGVPETALVAGLLSEPVSWCDARQAAGIMALAAESGRDVRLVIHPAARRRLDAARWLDGLGLRGSLILEDALAEPWRCVAGLDAALVLGDDTTTMDMRRTGSAFSLLFGGGRVLRPMPGVMPALWAMAAGVPVIADRSMAMQEIVGESEAGALVDQHDINGAASCIVRLFDDPEFRRRAMAAGPAHVGQNYHVSAYCVRLKDFYERIIEGREALVVDTSKNEAVIEKRRNLAYRR